MPSKERFWSRACLGGALLLAAYGIATSFWCSEMGMQFKQREIARDKRFHAALHELDEVRSKLASTAASNPDAENQYASAHAATERLADGINHESEADFSGTKALWVSAAGGAVLVAVYFGAAAWTWKRRSCALVSGAPSPSRP